MRERDNQWVAYYEVTRNALLEIRHCICGLFHAVCKVRSTIADLATGAQIPNFFEIL